MSGRRIIPAQQKSTRHRLASVNGDLSNDTIHIKSIVSLPQQTAQARPSQ
jgi:hypothetical protein